MKNTFLKKMTITILLLISVVYTSIASAHDQPGSLGAAAKATDMYLVTCSPDGNLNTDHLFVQVIGEASGPKVSAQVFKKVGGALNTSASVDIGTKVLRGGNGVYTVTVDKSAAGIANYSLSYHCQSGSDDHTLTDIDPLQDQ
jgi:hypothetical protein